MAAAFRLDEMTMTRVSPRQNDDAQIVPFCCCSRFLAPLSHETADLPTQSSSLNSFIFQFFEDLPSEIAVFGFPFARFRFRTHDFFLRTSHALAPFSCQLPSPLFVALSRGRLNPSWGRLGAILGHLGAVFGPYWAIVGPFYTLLGTRHKA